MFRSAISKDEYAERFQLNAPRLYRIAFCYVHNEQDALDIVSEAACKGLVKLHTLRDASQLDAWITRTVVNTAIDFTRRHHRCLPVADEQLDTLASLPPPDVEEYLDLYAALDRLESDQKIYIILKYFEGYTLREMSDLLGQPEATVKSRLYRILSRLRQFLQKEDRPSCQTREKHATKAFPSPKN